MPSSLEDRTLALAGVFQSALLVRQVAQHGWDINSATKATLHSIFKLDSADLADVYGGLHGLASGLKTLRNHLSSDTRHLRDVELTRHVIAMLFLERKLSRKSALLRQLREGIEAAKGQAEYFSETHPNVIARLADIYQNTVSTLTPRIMVSGNANVLSNPDNASLIRALLLGGVRSAVLWRQSGGNRWHLLLRRKAITETAARLVDSLDAPGTAP